MKKLERPKPKKKFPFVVSPVKKKEGRYCCAYNCKNKPIKKKGGLCHRHFRIKRKFIDPVYDRYATFKSNAKNRNIAFHVTLQEFRDWCKETGYIITKGMRGYNATIDRKWNDHGYYIWNMRLVTNRFNARKGDGEYEGDDDCPF